MNNGAICITAPEIPGFVLIRPKTEYKLPVRNIWQVIKWTMLFVEQSWLHRICSGATCIFLSFSVFPPLGDLGNLKNKLSNEIKGKIKNKN